MSLTHFTDRHLVRLLATQSRRTDITPQALSRSHVALGRFLVGELVEHFELESVSIQHPQGTRQGFGLVEEENISVLCFMRAGLYVVEGVREVLQRAPLFHVSPRRGEGFSAAERDELGDPAGRRFVVVDSVINTGASLEPVLQYLEAGGARSIDVLALVSPVPTAERLETTWPSVRFLLARLSENQYVGRGGTDTGNRLFGTLPGRAGGSK
ncbi:MAG: hypothetical protein GY898_25060 [Proteobacteria bacterium]|nr:hypothetical protein [Pseudomonadota bacterium]